MSASGDDQVALSAAIANLSRQVRRIRQRVTLLLVLVLLLIGVRIFDTLDVPRGIELAIMLGPVVLISILGTWWVLSLVSKTNNAETPDLSQDETPDSTVSTSP